MRVSSIKFAAAMLVISTTGASAQTVSVATRLKPDQTRATALKAAALLERRYLDPALGERYAATLRSRANSGVYAAYPDRQALADALTADLQAVHADGHLRFYVSRPEPQPASTATTPLQATGPIVAREGEASIAPGIRAMRWVAPGVAYVSFEHFDDRPEAMAALRRFLIDYASARALVIDSRENHGGAFDMLGVLGNVLFDRSRLLANMDMTKSVVDEFGAPFPVDGAVMKRLPGPAGLVRFQHWSVPAHAANWSSVPVFYLTSHSTFSAAEHLAMVLKSTRRATLIGETTGGGNHFGGTEPVGDGLELYVPIGRTTDPVNGQDWERIGIAPDVRTQATDALDVAIQMINGAAPPKP